ncbi:MAG TPA: hypothetical protein VK148_03750 [Xanthobacteraceae bacterium]|nr:hypothetical protein [Xanthobacteraceae bacterium]
MKRFRIRRIGTSCALAMLANWAACATLSAAPDISGTYWATTYSPTIQVLSGGAPPLNAAGKVAYEKNRAGLKDGSIVDKARRVCVPDGMPRVLATPYPFEILQVPTDQVTFVYEMNHQIRVIYIDKPLPEPHRLLVEPLYNGHSIGRWEGETLVVETAGFNERTFLDATGLPHGDAMRTIERIRKTAKELEILITIHDPEMYERDWQARFVYQERNDMRIEEYACNDNHRDLSAVKGVEPQ